jgi:hypothetical protein
MKHESARIAIPVFSLFALCLASYRTPAMLSAATCPARVPCVLHNLCPQAYRHRVDRQPGIMREELYIYDIFNTAAARFGFGCTLISPGHVVTTQQYYYTPHSENTF